MKSDKRTVAAHLTDDYILQSIQSSSDDTMAFLATREWGFEKLKSSVQSRGDTFDRCGGVLFEENGEEILYIPVSCMPATIGSSRQADYHLQYPGLSRLHCHLEFVGSLVRIYDDRSTNGVILNRKKVDSEDLCDGDELMLGSVTLRVRKV
jgi:hypothetical protein